MAREPRTDTNDPGPSRELLVLAGVLLLGAMAPLFDTTIVNVALHTLGRELGVPVATIQWVTTGYLLALAMSVPITGWAVERYGGKRMWIVAIGLFLAGSMLAGFSWNAGSLIAFRIVQGVGGGLMLPILQTLLLRAAGGRSIGRLMAVVTLPAVLGPIAGPVLGGLIVDRLPWRWIFYVNAPLCVAAIVLAWRLIPRDDPRSGRAGEPRTRPRLDVLGLVLLSPAIGAIVYALSRAGREGFAAPGVVVPLLAGVLLLGGFGWHAMRRPDPLVDLRTLGTRSFAASSALLFGSGFALYGSMLLLPLAFQQVRHATVLGAGLMLAPQGIGSLIARPLGALADRIGPRAIVLGGLALTVVGTVPFAVPGAYDSSLLLGLALIVRGIGLSGVNLAVMVGAFRDLPRAQIPHASSLTRITQQLGGSFGTAVLAVILQRMLAGAQGSAGAATSAGVAQAYGNTFWWAIGFTALAVLPALLLPGRRGSREPAGGLPSRGQSAQSAPPAERGADVST